jgi:cytochrome c-type biogenesis protein CcmH
MKPRRGREAFCVLATVGLLILSTLSVSAVTPEEMLKDPAMEARARELSQGLRCVVCQNQSIDDSNAPLAHDLRVLLRERLVAGDSDKAAIDYIVGRYGNFVLLKPPMQLNTLLLWIGPALVALLALLLTARYLREHTAAAPTVAEPLSEEDSKRAEALLGSGENR